MSEVRLGLTRAAPVALGMVPLGMAFGLLVVNLGLAWWWAPVFSAVVYAGSLEFLLATMVAAAVPLGQIVITTLVVNSRHVFYALSFPLHRVHPLARPYATFALTDEAYALTATPEANTWSSGRILALQALLQCFWVGGATAGALLGTALPLAAVSGLEFALTALFVVLALDAYRAAPSPRVVVTAIGSAVVAALLVPEQMLLVAYGTFALLSLLGARRAA
ncbi:AzlC family ABC transporter permease [Scrofimicrobium sp. R131]|uniref:AzlC family ABC transporter permease n=1 Tax=Scrofimicrobium appendicitidis TaxID=3079930 RepID=A0AAU7V5E0_9ACTO